MSKMRAKVMLVKVGQVSITNIDLNTTLHHVPSSLLSLSIYSTVVCCYCPNIMATAHNHPT